MTALMRYRLATLLHSQRYVPPVTLFLAAVVVGTANASGPLLPLYALCAGALFVVMTWLTIALVNIEGPEQRAITLVAAGRSRDLLVATVGVALACGVVLTAVGLLLPLELGSHTVAGLVLATGAAAQITCASAGVAVGVLCSRQVIGRPGYALFASLGLVLALLLGPGVPPVNSLLRVLSRAPEPIAVLWPLVGSAAGALVLLLASATVAHIASSRGR